MKCSIFLMSLMSFFMISCSKTNKLESEAKEVMNQTFHEIAKDASSLKLSNVKTVFGNDSLCILHLDLSAKNGLGIESTSKMEYVYLVSDGKKFESYQELNSDSIYLDKESFEKVKKGKIYEELPYESALYYLSAVFVNTQGRVVGDKFGEQEVKIPVPTGTGLWNLRAYKDEFGEEGAEKYLTLRGHGTFSNSATTGSRLTAILFASKSGFAFRLIEYDSNIVKTKDYYECKIKDSEGDIHTMNFRNNEESGDMTTWIAEEMNEIHEALSKGGVITVSIREEYAYSTPDTYLFKMDVTGFNEAFNQIIK